MLDNIFTSLSSELSPSPPTKRDIHTATHVAIILTDGGTLSESDIRQICDNTQLSPLFFAFSRGYQVDVARRYARAFDASLIMPKNSRELSSAMTRVAFSVSESFFGALCSLISCTPSYVNSSCRDCRALIGELSARSIPDGILIPYTKGRADRIKKVRAQVSDFEFAVAKIRGELRSRLFEINPRP